LPPRERLGALYVGLLEDRETEPRGAVERFTEGAEVLAWLCAREFDRGTDPPCREDEPLDPLLARELVRGAYPPELVEREDTPLDELRGETLVARLDDPLELPGEILVARLAARLLGSPEIRELLRGANVGEAEPTPEPKLERGPDDVRVRGELLSPDPPPRGEALGAGLLGGAARGLLGAGLDDLDLTLGARGTGAGDEGLELFSIRDRPELGAGRELPEPEPGEELADGTREELRPIGSLPRSTREFDPFEDPVERVSRPPKRLQPSFPLLELEPEDRTDDGVFSPPLPRLLERTEELLEVPAAPLVSVPSLVPSLGFRLTRPGSLFPRTEVPALDSVPGEPSRPLALELPPTDPRALLCPRTEVPAPPLLSPAPPRTTERPALPSRDVPPATAPPRADPASRRWGDSLKALTDWATCCC
jgi:hypothetical protein